MAPLWAWPPYAQCPEVPHRRAGPTPGKAPLRNRADDLVFTSPEGGPLRRYFAEPVFNPAIKRAGLDPSLTFHGLRHVAASLSFEQGEHRRVIQGRLGHATARSSMELYAHVPEAADRDVANHLDSRWNTFTWHDRWMWPRSLIAATS